jgi:predicted nucleotidyltransferase
MDDILGNEIRLGVLRVLVACSPQGKTGRALSRDIGFSPTQTGRALGALEGVGIVRREAAGRAFLWKFASEHLLARSVIQLFAEEGESLQALKSDLEEVVSKLPTERVWLFGSIARGEERPTSDIDLMVEVEGEASKQEVEDALIAMTTKFIVRFGNPLSPLVVDRTRKKRKLDPALLRTVQTEGVLIESER